MTFAAHCLGVLMLLVLFMAVWIADHKDFDPTRVNTPLDAAEGIVPLLSMLTLAWWLLFR